MTTETELAWLAGLLEGEGSFCETRIHVAMTDRDVIERAAEILGGQVKEKRQPPGRIEGRAIYVRKPLFYCIVYGKRAKEAMVKLFSYMGKRRQAQIEEQLSVLHFGGGRAAVQGKLLSQRNRLRRRFTLAEARMARMVVRASGKSVAEIARVYRVPATTFRRMVDADGAYFAGASQ